MGNNAVESVVKVMEQENRQILLEVYQKDGFRMIQVENYCNDAPLLIDGLPQTTKADKFMHGYGLKSVQLTVQKLNGTLRCTYESGWFTAKILIPGYT